MTAVIIIAAIALLTFFLLASFVTADLEYDGVFKFKVKYLCFTLAKNPLSPKEEKKKKLKEEKKKRKKEKKEQKEKAKRDKLLAKKRKARNKTAAAVKSTKAAKKNTDTEDPGETSPESDTNTKKAKAGDKDKSDKDDKRKITPELIFRIFGKAKPHVKRIFKKIRISGVYIDATIGGEDAAKAAISYGVHCAAIDGLIAFLDNTVSFRAEKISIRADFRLEKSVYYCKARVKLRLSTLLHSGIWGALAIIGELNEVSDITEEENKKSPQKAA